MLQKEKGRETIVNFIHSFLFFRQSLIFCRSTDTTMPMVLFRVWTTYQCDQKREIECRVGKVKSCKSTLHIPIEVNNLINYYYPTLFHLKFADRECSSVCCKSLKYAFNWVLRHWQLEKIHKLIKIPFYWCRIFHAKDADRVFAWGLYTSSFYVMETSKNTSTNWKVYIALKCKRAEPQSPSHQKSLISDWYFTHSKIKSTWSRNCLCVTFAQQSWSCFYWKMKCKVFGSYFRISWIVLAWMRYAF